MITEKQKEAVMELCRYVENFCKENDLSAFMSVAASEDHPDGLEQVAGSIVTGKGDMLWVPYLEPSKLTNVSACCCPWR